MSIYRYYHIAVIPSFYIHYQEIPIIEEYHIEIGFEFLGIHWCKTIVKKPLKNK